MQATPPSVWLALALGSALLALAVWQFGAAQPGLIRMGSCPELNRPLHPDFG